MTNLPLTIKVILRRNPLFIRCQSFQQRCSYKNWIQKGNLCHHLISLKKTIHEYAKKHGIHIFIDIGDIFRRYGSSNIKIFDRIYSIEIGLDLYLNAQKRFANSKHVKILHGDSSDILVDLLKKIETPCLFWLDGDYSVGITGRGKFGHANQNRTLLYSQHPQACKHIILIDDARCFTGEGDYPTLEQLKEWANAGGV